MIIIFKIIFTLHRVNGDSTPSSQIFKHLVHNFHNIHPPVLLHILFFLESPIEEKFELEKSMKDVQTMLESQQNKLDSQYSQIFTYHASFIPFLQQSTEEKSELEKSIEAMQRPNENFRKCWPPQFHNIFKSHIQSHLFKMIKHQSFDMRIELLH